MAYEQNAPNCDPSKIILYVKNILYATYSDISQMTAIDLESHA